MRKISIYVFVVSLMTSQWSALAEQQKNQFRYVSGKIQAGCLLISTNDQLYVDEKNEKTGSLNHKSGSFLNLEPGLLLDLNVFFPSGTNLYFGNPEEDAGKAIKLGCSQTLKNNSVMGVSAKYKYDESAWEDPFVTDQNRADTDVDVYVYDIFMERIAGTGLAIDYSYETVDVDHDVLGARYNELKRDGVIHSLSVGYTFTLAANQFIVPGLQYSTTDYDGKSNNFSSYSGSIDYVQSTGHLVYTLSLSATNDRHQKIHPVPEFNKKRNDVTFETAAIVTWLNPMGYHDYFINLGGVFIENESNINFFDSTTYLGIVSLGYRF